MALLAALEWLKERRPIASPHPAYMDELVEWEVAWRKRPSLRFSARYSDGRYSRAEDLKLLLTPRSARAEAKEEDVWRPSARRRAAAGVEGVPKINLTERHHDVETAGTDLDGWPTTIDADGLAWSVSTAYDCAAAE